MKDKIQEILKDFPQVSLIDNYNSTICDFFTYNNLDKTKEKLCFDCMLKCEHVIISIKFDNDDHEEIRTKLIQRFREAGIELSCIKS